MEAISENISRRLRSHGTKSNLDFTSLKMQLSLVANVTKGESPGVRIVTIICTIANANELAKIYLYKSLHSKTHKLMNQLHVHLTLHVHVTLATSNRKLCVLQHLLTY